MFARSANRNVVLAAAAALTGVGAAVALAQESPPDLASYLARCDGVKDANRQVGCLGEEALKHAQDSAKFHGKGADAADKRIAALKTEGTEIHQRIEKIGESIAASEKRTETANVIVREAQCARDLADGVTKGVLNRQKGQELLGGQLPSAYGNCRLLGQLREFARLMN